MTRDPQMSPGTELERFVEAQDDAGTYAGALAELRAGRKVGHWMWFVFPQLAGLGRSATSRYYAIAGLAEAQAYVRHPVLGPRLVECAEALLGVHDRSAVRILGGIDAKKLHSSMTLFALAAPEVPAFRAVLDRYFEGTTDDDTLRLLDPADPS